jgi:hypothetical protein
VEVSALGQKKRAAATGILAFDGPLGDLRLDVAIKSHPWLQNTGTTTFLLSTWASRALQDMAAVIEADAQKLLGHTGKMPEATFMLADGLYDAALKWIDLAQSALAAIESESDFVLTVRLPSPPPRFDWVAEAPPAHFVAAVAGAVQLGTSVEDALNTMQNDRSRLPHRYNGAFEAIAGSIKFARAKLDQVEAAASDRQAVRLSRDIWAMLQEVVRLYFLAGQQVAMPGLINPKYDAFAEATARARRLPAPPSSYQGQAPAQPGPAAPAPAPRTHQPAQPAEDWGSVDWTGQGRRRPEPAGPARSPVHVSQGYAPRTMGQSSAPPQPVPPQPVPPQPAPPQPAPPPTLGERLGLHFDAWALTDPGAKATYQNDRTRIAELEAFWKSDTNPDETYRLFSLITAAIKADQVAVRPGEFSRSCPWISTFVARVDAVIGSEKFKTGQLFTLKAGTDGEYFGRGFELLGFLPGTQPKPRPKPRPQPEPSTPGTPSDARKASEPTRIDTEHYAERKPRATTSAAQPQPGIPGEEDMWSLTADFQRPQRRANRADAEQMKALWRADPDPASTLAIRGEIVAAVRAGNVRQQGDEALRDCPWSQVYVAVKPVTVGGVRLQRNEKFALEVGVSRGQFKRGIERLGLLAAGG